jgi:hypothetical protein
LKQPEPYVYKHLHLLVVEGWVKRGKFELSDLGTILLNLLEGFEVLTRYEDFLCKEGVMPNEMSYVHSLMRTISDFSL